MHTIKLLVGKLEILLEVEGMKVSLNFTDLVKLFKSFNIKWRIR